MIIEDGAAERVRLGAQYAALTFEAPLPALGRAIGGAPAAPHVES